MPVVLITGPHQSGKTRRLWELLREAPLGGAGLVTAMGGWSRDDARAWHAAFGPGPMPPAVAFEDWFLRAAGSAPAPSAPAAAAHILRRWCADGGLHGTPLEPIARFRATADDLADLCLRLDLARIGDDDLALAARKLRPTRRALAAKIEAVARARAALATRLLTRGASLARLAAGPLAAPWPLIGFDDLIAVSAAELAALRSLAERATLVLTAVDDPRLGRGRLAERLRSAFPGAREEHLGGTHSRSAHLEPTRELLAGALDERRLPSAATALYHYRDDAHAGRAIAAWLRRSGTAPGEATLYVRAGGEEALALADALAAAGVPVHGSFALPLGTTAAGGLLSAIGAWCAEQTWERLIACAERLALVAGGGACAPLPPRQLLGPWGQLRVEDALARLQASAGKPVDGWEWRDPAPKAPLREKAAAWMRERAEMLAPGGGGFIDRVGRVCRAMRLGGADEALARAAELAALGPIGPRELDEAIGAATVSIRRGEDADPDRCLRIVDAVRGRAAPRPVVILHGLEHGRWPAMRHPGACFPREDRARLVSALDERDPWDEDGRASGEVAAFLAALARGTRLAVLGVPCGEREPSPWLPTLAAQLGIDLAKERARAGVEAAPGAPLGPGDSLSPQEAALWRPVGRPSFAFVLPRRSPNDLGVAASRLNDLLRDPFAFALSRLGIDPPLAPSGRRGDGDELHRLLERLNAQPAERWEHLLPDLLEDWLDAAADPFARAARARAVEGITKAVADEATAMAGWTVAKDRGIELVLRVGDEELRLRRNEADRVDLGPDGAARIVDWKYQRVSPLRQTVAKGWEGQLAAYAEGLRQRGLRVVGAHYRALLDGDAAGYDGPGAAKRLGREPAHVDALGARIEAIVAAIARLATGQAATDPEEGLCDARGYAPIARLDEARLDLGGEDERDGEGEGE